MRALPRRRGVLYCRATVPRRSIPSARAGAVRDQPTSYGRSNYRFDGIRRVRVDVGCNEERRMEKIPRAHRCKLLKWTRRIEEFSSIFIIFVVLVCFNYGFHCYKHNR
ncbi:hypothetical protein PFISCL1PPCAC_22563 [Pristionchus fissidentatus]|uniref:Ribosomal protein n=1 Tax=Pristionchus fissidentatus TaxID=1538716 RepID=A0AAV5WK28_9BILA|nr:hypothetical protein PFISCL1PPCAC_22563 [Pristionchus fissidentatus]